MAEEKNTAPEAPKAPEPFIPEIIAVTLTGKAREGYLKARASMTAKGIKLGDHSDVIVRLLEATAAK